MGNQKAVKCRWADNTVVKTKNTINDLQNIAHKTKDRPT